MDYEHQPSNHVAFRLADLTLLPEALPPALVARQGAKPRKVRVYPGLKEEIVLGAFAPDDGILERIGLDVPEGGSVVVVRPPPSRAIYHRHPNNLYVDAL